MVTSIVAAVLILGLLVFVHELGHFVAAKRCGVRVLRFSIGYPPTVWSFRRGETEYAIGATPFGGYVRMLGDEVADELSVQDIETYLKELSSDLLQFAGQHGALSDLPEQSEEVTEGWRVGSDEVSHRVVSRVLESGKSGTSSGPGSQMLTLARRLGLAEGDEARVRRVFGRALRPDEQMLLTEVKLSNSLDEAVTRLSHSAPPALISHTRQSAFPTQSLAKRLLIVLAGPLANIAFAPVILALIFMYGVPRLLPILGQIKKDLPAYTAGLKAGDRIVAIDGRPVQTWDELSAAVKQSGGARLQIDVERADGGVASRHSVDVRPVKDTTAVGGGSAWIIGILPRGDSVVRRSGPLSAAVQGFTETARLSTIIVAGLAKLIGGGTPLREAIGGPIMIAQLAGHEAKEGFANVSLFAAMLSVQLGIINLFPIPMLDGGHLLFFLVEGVRGKPLQVRHRELAQQVGLFIIVVLMAFAIFNDISRIVQG